MRTVITIVGVLFAVSSAAAQTLTPRMLGQVSGKREATSGEFEKVAARDADTEATSDITAGAGMGLLSQADVQVDGDTTQLGLQALDLFFDKNWRLYVRSTLPVPEEKKEETAGSGVDEPTDDTSSELSAAAISALVDPYGGVLNLSTGAFLQIPSFLTPRNGGGQADADHGLFVDARFGLKLVNLPDQAEDSPSLLNTTVSPFYSAVVMFKIVRDVFPKADGKETAGGFEFGIGAVVNVAADKSTSTVFADGVLDTTTTAVRCDVALSLTSIAAINVSWTPWSSNDTFGKRFMVGLKLLNQNPAVK